MMLQLRRIFVPYLLLAAGAAVCFQLFGSPDGWKSPFYRFISIEDEDTASTIASYPTLNGLTWLYTLAVDIAVLNLMIAVMTDTYFKMVHPSPRHQTTRTVSQRLLCRLIPPATARAPFHNL